MGREAYLARLAFGRSAFGPPIRDQNGDFVVGDHVHNRDDVGYRQQWDDRGHPKNVASVQSGKDYRRAQNEVLEACGIVIRKNAARRRDPTIQDPSNDEQLERLKDENNEGFALKYGDRFGGYLLTWWLESSRKRWLVGADMTLSTFTSSIVTSFKAAPLQFLYGGFVSWLISSTARIMRRPDIVEPVGCMNYLGVHMPIPVLSVRDRVEILCEDVLYALIEIPCAFLSILQAIGHPVLAIIWTRTRSQLMTSTWTNTLVRVSSKTFGEHNFIAALGLYWVRDHLSHQFGWRSYGLLRQTMSRPDRPTQLSIVAAEEDDLLDDISVIGIGRSLGTYTDQRFYGCSSFWSALSIGFPWLSWLLPAGHDILEIKHETLRRCAVMERDRGDYGAEARTVQRQRAQNIISNLQSLGIDVEEDFYVDVDQWTRDISFLDGRASYPADWVVDGDIIQDLEDSRAEATINTTGFDEHAEVLANWRQVAATPATPPTPEPGIVRATSLSEITPRPVRRPTETVLPELDEDMQAIIAVSQRTNRTRRKRKDDKLYRITRMTVLPVDSFAWHASSVLTSLILIPVDVLFLRALVGWYTSATGESKGAFSSEIQVWPLDLRSMTYSKLSWNTIRMIGLSYGCELVIRGLLWQLSSRTAVYYGHRNSWGKF